MNRQHPSPLQLRRTGSWGLAFAALAVFALIASPSRSAAAPANDNWAGAQLLTGGWGSVTADNTGATPEPGEPGHAGFPANSSIWYRWVAPSDGEVSVDTHGSQVDTTLAVYVGTNVTHLRQVAANDDTFPLTLQANESHEFSSTSFQPLLFAYLQPYSGPSSLTFNATAGTTYYFAVDTKTGPGSISLSWAFHSSGVFRFAAEDQDFNLGAIPIYQVGEYEALPDSETTEKTYYIYGVPGAALTVTRVAGSTGRILVDYATVELPFSPTFIDIPAVPFFDYLPLQGTLTFDDWEMSKKILIPVGPNLGPDTNRIFAVVLSNARPDPNESPDVSPPRIDPFFGVALVRILDQDIDPVLERNFDTNGVFTFTTNSIFNFGKAHFVIPEDVSDYWPNVTIWVNRFGTNRQGETVHYRINNYFLDNQDVAEEDNNWFPLQPASDYATPQPPISNFILGTGPDFFLNQGTVTFGQDDFLSKPINFAITNDTLVEFNEDFHITLFKIVNNAPIAVGTVNDCSVTILFDDRDAPAGSVDEFWNADFGANMKPAVATTPPNLPHPGADGVVYSLVAQPDGKTIVAGNFLFYNNTPRNCIARMNADGVNDVTFNPGSGASDFISSVLLTPAGQLIIAGGFSSFNGTPRNGVAQLNSNGSLDGSFNTGLGPNGAVWATALQSDGKVLVAGEFTSINGNPRPHVARLNADGSVDPSFDPGTNGPNGTVWAMTIQPNGKILLGGEFTLVGGQVLGGIARLNTNGTLDATYNLGVGADGIVYALALQSNGRLWIGGEFNNVQLTPAKRFARLNVNGSLDTTFDPGTSANGTIYSIAVQPDGTVYVGGIFTAFNGTHRLGFTRLFADGSVDTGFLDTAYNQFAGLHRRRFSDPPGTVFTSTVQPDGGILIGGTFEQVGGGQANPDVRVDPNDPAGFNQDVYTEPKSRDGIRNRSNVARLLGGFTPGPGNIGLLYNTYSASENQGFLSVGLSRTGGTLGYASANFAVQPGLVQAGTDYGYYNSAPVLLSTWHLDFFGPQPSQGRSRTRMHSDGLFGTNTTPVDIFDHLWFGYSNALVNVSLVNDNLVQGNRDTTFQLANPVQADQFLLGGENIPLATALGRGGAPFSIIDDDHNFGSISFAASNFNVNENSNSVTITVIRTNGSFGTVSVAYLTTNGTAISGPGLDYTATSGNLTFFNGQTNKTFTVLINNDSLAEDDETFGIRLYNANGGATLGLANATVTIVDDDSPNGRVNFAASAFSTNEDAAAAIITVTRGGGSQGALSVTVATGNGTAQSGVDYFGATNVLSWGPGVTTPRTLTVPLINNTVVDGNRTVFLRLAGASVNGVTNPASLGSVSNAFLTIVDDDAYGRVAFNRASYFANENGGPAVVTVTRASGLAQSVTVSFATAGGTNVSTADYTPTNGTLSFGPGELSKSFSVPILDNQFQNGIRSVNLVISNAVPGGSLGTPSTSYISIVDDESFNEPPGSPDTGFLAVPGFNGDVYGLALEPNGTILAAGDFTVANNVPRGRLARLNPSGTLDLTFGSPSFGANAAIRALALQSDNRVVIGGFFTSVNGVTVNRLSRLLANGASDSSFNIGSGADNTVYAAVETFVVGQRKLLVGGAFLNFNGVAVNGLVRLHDDGSRDTSFDTGQGFNGTVYAILTYPTNSVRAGQILVAGDFTTVGGIGRSRLARLLPGGALDLTFNTGSGPDDSVRALALQGDEQVLVGGLFANFNGVLNSHFARLTGLGALDPTFALGAGANDLVSAIALQPDNKILLGGQFTSCSGVNRHRITRLNPDGTVDPTINFGLGANSFVSSVLLQPDNKILAGGGFTTFDGGSHSRIVRLYGGSVSGSGRFEFDAGTYQVDENGTNALVTIRRRGGSSGAPGDVSVTFMATNGTAVAGVNYFPFTNVLAFPPGEVFQTVSISVTQDFVITPDLTVELSLSDPQPAGDPTFGFPTLGGQVLAELTVLNDDSGVSFSSGTYSRNEDAIDGRATIPILRAGSTRGPASVTFFTTTNGTAVANLNYTPTTNLVSFTEGQSSNYVQVPVLHDPTAQGDRTVVMQLTNANNSLLLVPVFSTLTVVDVEHLPGQFQFGQTNYIVGEGDGALPITIVRTNGKSGIVSVNFATIPGTALPGAKYVSTNGILTFSDAETNKTFTVGIVDNASVEGNQTFTLILSNATGGATFRGPTSVPATIIDNDVGVGFSSPAYVVSETGGAISLTVLRQNGTNAVTRVSYATTNVYFTTTNNGVIITNIGALAGTNYAAVTNSLIFTNGETIKSFSIQVLHDPRVTGDLPFGVNLFAPTNLSDPTLPAQLLPPATAIVTVLDSEAGMAFTNANFTTTKSATNVIITVLRTNGNTGIVSVNYATATNGSAVAGVDFVSSSGTLTFSNGISSQTFAVPIINNQQVSASNLTFNVVLANPTPTNIARLIPPSVATVTITNDLSGFSFSAAGYSINENGGAATITVLRTGFTNSIVSVAFGTANGTGLAGVNYVPTSGVFTFTNGETVKTFPVTVIDNGVVDGDKTVLLSLSDPGGNAVLVNPSASTLTVNDIDGTSVIAAGSALVSESGPVNSVIDSNETVTVLFALRAAGGTNTASLTATLLATNGVSNPSAPQNYGALITHGPSVFRPFTFKANGTNGQVISAVFRLQDGGTSLSNAAFNFTLGNLPVVFANPAMITINDFTNATPYPSTINVTALAGSVAKTTVTITNLNHTSPRDIDMLLVSPSGLKSYLMAKCGGNNAVSRVTLTFDDAFPALPTGQIVSGTNRPTAFPVAPPPFPVPAPPAPYNTNLSIFVGSNPNGVWSLYVFDDTHFDSGAISNGWSLSFNAAAPAAADLGVSMAASSTTTVVSSNVTFFLVVTNFGPAPANNLTLSDSLPAGVDYISSTASAGTVSTNGNGQLTWTIATLATNGFATNAIVVRAGVAGPMTNTASVLASTTDGNPDNNSASATVNVSAPSADLSLLMIGAPNPTVVGGTVTYTLTVTNSGPATAVGVGLTNTLSPGVSFLYATPSNSYSATAGTVAFTNLGSLGSGRATNVFVVVRTVLAGTLTNIGTVASTIFDPLKAGNTASVKTEVQGVQLSFQRTGGSLTISWPISPVNYNLEGATNLFPPVIWIVVASNTPPVGGQMSVTVPIGSGKQFFRLRGAGP